MYDPRLVEPMRKELTSLGVEELTSSEQVDRALKESSGTALVVVNSVCGCAAGAARPAVALALTSAKKPNKLYTVFAGQDKEATDRARSYFTGYPPSSPSIALFKDGEVVGHERQCCSRSTHSLGWQSSIGYPRKSRRKTEKLRPPFRFGRQRRIHQDLRRRKANGKTAHHSTQRPVLDLHRRAPHGRANLVKNF